MCICLEYQWAVERWAGFVVYIFLFVVYSHDLTSCYRFKIVFLRVSRVEFLKSMCLFVEYTETHTQTHTHAHKDIHTRIHTQKHTQRHIDKDIHTRTLTQRCTQRHTHTQRYSQRHIDKDIHTRTHTQRHTQRHTYTHMWYIYGFLVTQILWRNKNKVKRQRSNFLQNGLLRWFP